MADHGVAVKKGAKEMKALFDAYVLNGTYFSILELIAAGKTARTEIESLLEVDIGGYLDRLENRFDLVSDIKLNPAKLNLALLKSNATSLLQSYPGHHPQWLGLSLANIADYL